MRGSRTQPANYDDVAVREAVVPAGTQRSAVPVRIYQPVEGRDLGALVLFHGGGFIAGDLETDDAVARDYCHELKIAVVSVDYRLAPEHPYPAALEDAYAALCWVADNAATLGVDPARIAVGGGSAGGGIAAGLALLARDRGGPDVCFQMLLVPALLDEREPLSHATTGGRFDAAAARRMWEHYLGVDAAARATATYAAPAQLVSDLGGLPPAYITVATNDPLRDAGIRYALRLLAAGNAVDLHLYAGSEHGFVSHGRATEAGARAFDDRIRILVGALS